MVQHTRVKDLHGEPGALAIVSSNLTGPIVFKISGIPDFMTQRELHRLK